GSSAGGSSAGGSTAGGAAGGGSAGGQVANTSPTISNLVQRVGTSLILQGATVADTPAFFSSLADADGDEVAMEVELIASAGTFSGTATSTGAFAAPGISGVMPPTLTAGDYRWRARAIDTRGGASQWVDYSSGTAFTMLPAQISMSMSINAGAASTSDQLVTVTITGQVSNGGSISTMRVDAGQGFGTQRAFMNTFTVMLPAGDGLRQIRVELTDNLGNTKIISDSIILDQNGPIGLFNVNNQATHTNDPVIEAELFYSDTNGLTNATMRYRINGGAFTTPSPYSALFNITLPSTEAQYTIELIVTDATGNDSASFSRSIVLDTTAPIAGSTSLWGALTSDTTNTRTPLIATNTGDLGGLSRYCYLVAPGTTPPAQPPANDPCWRDVSGISAVVSAQLQLPSTEGLYRAAVFIKDRAGNIGAGDLAITYDATPPTGTITLLSSTAGHHRVKLRYATITAPADVGSGTIGYQLGVNTQNGGSQTPSLFIWGPVVTGTSVGTNTYEDEFLIGNGETVSVAVRVVDRAGNGGPMSNVVVNQTPRFTFQPFFATPTNAEMTHVVRHPLGANGSRYFISGRAGNTYSSDDDGVTWSRRDPLTEGDTQGLAASPTGIVLTINAPVAPSINQYFTISGDQGRNFRRLVGFASGTFHDPTYIGPRAAGGHTFGYLSNTGTPQWLAVNALNELVGFGTGSTPYDTATTNVKFKKLAGCTIASAPGAVGITDRGVYRSQDEGFSYEAVPLPSTWPSASATLVDVSGNGSDVLVLAQKSAGVLGVLRSVDCGASWNEMTGVTWPASLTAAAISAGGGSQGWVLSRTATLENVLVTHLSFTGTTPVASSNEVSQASTSRLNAIAGNSSQSVVIAGARGAIFSTGSFPSWASRRGQPYQPLRAISARRGVAVGSAGTATTLALGGDSGYVAFSPDSGGGWAPAPLGNTTAAVTSVAATNQTFAGLGAVNGTQELWLNPQTGWQSRAPTPLITGGYTAITCEGSVCLAAGSQGTISIIQHTSGMVQSSHAVAPGAGPTWTDIDRTTVSSSARYTAVGGNGSNPTTQIISLLAGPVNTITGTGVSRFSSISLRRDGSGDALVTGASGFYAFSFDYGATFPVQGDLGTPNLNDCVHLAGTNVWVAVGDGGHAYLITRGTSSATVEEIPTNTTADLVSVDASESDSNLVWMVGSDGTALMSRVGAKRL
ncbi:MAG: Ig-like domain repeat protein, partial [Archangium sp.]|nr:Ig-like domain repeat protein [Archangium sp.]